MVRCYFGCEAYRPTPRKSAPNRSPNGFARSQTRPHRRTTLRVVDEPDVSKFVAGETILFAFVAPDAAVEGVPLALLASTALNRTVAAVDGYRAARTPKVLLIGTGYALAATAALVLVVFLLNRLSRRLKLGAEHQSSTIVDRARTKADMHDRPLPFLDAERLAAAIRSGIGVLHRLMLIAVALFYLNVVFALFPWTSSR